MTKLSKSMGMGVGISRSINRVSKGIGKGIGFGYGGEKGKGSSNITLLTIIVISTLCAFAILILNKDMIKETFFSGSSGTKRYSLEYYYMDTCVHCETFNKKGIWDELSNMTFNNVELKKFDNVSNADRLKVMEISSFPTFIMVDNQISSTTPIDSFEEERTKEKLLQFINKYENKK